MVDDLLDARLYEQLGALIARKHGHVDALQPREGGARAEGEPGRCVAGWEGGAKQAARGMRGGGVRHTVAMQLVQGRGEGSNQCRGK